MKFSERRNQTMTREERFSYEMETVRRFFAGKNRKELLEIRKAVDEQLGYQEFVEKVRSEGIVL